MNYLGIQGSETVFVCRSFKVSVGVSVCYGREVFISFIRVLDVW